jgi:serine/threonine protein kinase/energy-coupling factor transporter ATP-binding protein EcfA2
MIDGRFAILRNEGERRGGTALVYKAVDTKTGQQVAVKVFDGVRVGDDLLYEFFQRETEALTRLKHPAIVDLVTKGKDESLNRYFVALEWLDETLQNYIKRQAPESWDSFSESIFVPILEGLAFAHSRHVLHRDIKPSNILIGTEGPPRLADFGIAKIVDSLRVGQTVKEFRSVPYAPPEHGTEPATSRGDLFSLGITVLTCLVPNGFQITHENIDEAIREANIPEIAAVFLKRLTALDPKNRPFNAETALAEYLSLQRSQPRDDSAFPRYHLRLSRKAEEKVTDLLGLSSGDAIRSAIVQDLNRRAAILYKEPDSPEKDGTFSLLGDEFSYHVAVANQTEDHLVILSVNAPPPSLLERLREGHLSLAAVFAFGSPLRPQESKTTILRLREIVSNFHDEQHIAARQAEEMELFRRWRDILRAKDNADKENAEPLEYTSLTIEGENVRFKLTSTVANNEITRQRLTYTIDRKIVAGTVEDASGNELLLHVERGDIRRLPPRGRLVIDNTPSRISLQRQRHALDDVQFGTALRPDLKDLLLYPEKARVPILEPLPPLLQPKLDSAKQDALRAALSAEDFIAVQGPPGTGKTTWIAELVGQFLRNKGGRVLLTGQTHIAVDNALEGIERLAPGKLKIIRVGTSAKKSEQAENFRMDFQMEVWRRDVQSRGEAWLREWATAHGVPESQLTLGGKVEALETAERTAEGLRKEQGNLESQERILIDKQTATRDLADTVFARVAEVEELIRTSATIRQQSHSLNDVADVYVEVGLRLAQSLQDAVHLEEELSDLRSRATVAEESAVVIEEQARQLRGEIGQITGNASLTTAVLDEIRRVVQPSISAANEQAYSLTKLQALQAEWTQRFGVGVGFRDALLITADIVAGTCIGVVAQNLDELEFDLVVIDEASKATPTEALTAMVRGKRWILVGDQKQLPPFADDSLEKMGLLQRFNLSPEDLRKTLFDRLVTGLPEVCCPTLTEQHRMHPAIGQLISNCFYRGKLTSARPADTHPVLSQILKRPVTWYSTSSLPNRDERAGRSAKGSEHSRINPEEAARIRQWLERLERSARTVDTKEGYLKVGVISGYYAQKKFLDDEIIPKNNNKWQRLNIEINSVDEFQGREVDVLVFSVTRSNHRGQLGFVRLPHRLNVALSRGRDALVIFGDAERCRQCPEDENAFSDVLQHILQNPTACAMEGLR